MERKSALLLRLGGLGDILITLPSLMLLRKAFPDLDLHLVAREDIGALIRDAGVVARAFSADEARWSPLFGDSPRSLERSAQTLSSSDFVIAWFQKNPPPSVRPALSGSAAELRVIAYDPGARLPLSRFFFGRTREFVLSRGRAVFDFDECALLPRAEGPREKAFAVIHPGSGNPRKCWPLDRFLRIIAFLAERGFTGALLTGEAEERLERHLERISFPPGWRWMRRPDLRAVAGLLSSAALYVGNDSGVTHLAAACGTKVFAVFRKEFEALWTPFGRTVVLSAETVEDITWETVAAAIGRGLPKP